MSINPEIFRSYDIRGTYPDELNEEAAYAIGRAFVRKSQTKEVVVGSDMRLSGPSLKTKLIKGITDEGAKVFDIGLVSIDTIYFAVGILGHQAGIMITASHNPKEYNGFKMVLKDMQWIRGEDLKDDVLNLPALSAEAKGSVEKLDIMPQFIDHLLSFVDVSLIKPFKVIVDAGNGMAGKIIPLLEPHLPIKVTRLNFELDGSFPAHPSNPLLPESQRQVIAAVLEEQADFGVIFDGDTDRLNFIDEQGQFIKGDIGMLLLAKEFLKREPGKGISYNVSCSKIVPEKIKEWGGVPLRSKVGYVNVSDAMRDNDGIMGGEISSHYSFRDNAYADSGFIAFLILLQLISSENKPLSEIVKPWLRYYKAPEENIRVENRQKIFAIIEGFKHKYTDGQQDELDGLTVQYQDWWFNVRPSNTEPLLRITIEADSPELLDNKLAELKDFALSLK
ncbi:MAG: phosphomannomutase/phosphoglucomutase [Patescibacteria group bacterium]|jgi:phosphomannomutase|nr:phosphomannomutase/phosphoglucomutase [Patescibacteria group bacterium]